MISYQGMVNLTLTVVLLVLPSLIYGETLYVRPTSSSTLCPTHPCHTLSEYAHDIGQYFNESNLTLQLLPGNHTLDVNLTIASIHQLEILDNTSAMVPTRVVCNSNVGLAFRNIQSKVRIHGLAFVTCARFRVVQVGYSSFTTYYGLHLQSVQMAEIIDCTFQDSYGSALGVVDSHVVFRGNNSFLNNCNRCSNGRCYFRGPRCYGGGIFIKGSNLSLTGSNSFTGNFAIEYGGGIYAGSNSWVNISGNTTFSDNTAGSGGGIGAQDNSRVNITGNSTFICNSAVEGGGVYVGSDSHATISENTTFIGNSGTDGGGVRIVAYSRVYVSGNATFIGNSARFGGGISVWSYSKVDISKSTRFIGNSAYRGGGIHTNASSNVDISGNATFTGNSATNGAGVYAVTNSSVNICGNTTFYGNLAKKSGGGIYVVTNSSVDISDNTTFIGNSAMSGGGVYAKFNSNVSASGNTIFTSNSATNGGGIDAQFNTYVNISGNTAFIGNSASNGSGGICVEYNSSLYISGITTFLSNSARFGGGVGVWFNSDVDISGNTTFAGNSAIFGGGVSATSSSTDTNMDSRNTTFSIVDIGTNTLPPVTNYVDTGVSNVTINCNNIFFLYGIGGNTDIAIFPNDICRVYHYCRQVSSNVKISGNTTFMGNSAVFGGGVSVMSYSNVEISGNTTFIDNSAKFGGGIYATSNSSMDISGNTTFVGNSATSDGGGVSAESNSAVNISGNTHFIGNSAIGEGGGLRAEINSNVNIGGNAKFSINSARDGGCVFIDTVQISTDSSVSAIFVQINIVDYRTHTTFLNLEGNGMFTNCSATNNGGAIYARGTHANFSGTNVFRANRAQFGGGLYVEKSSLNLPGDNTFTDNIAGNKGGGIYAQGSKMRFSGTGLFRDNLALLDGGGIYADGSNLDFSANLTISSNAAQVGGGIYSDNSTMNSNGWNVVESNVATYYGGGVFMRRTFLVHIGNNKLSVNSAGEGGAIHATANSRLSLNGVNTFIGNRAHVSGGGIWLDNSNLAMNGFNHFVECVASYEGGAIFTYATTATLHGNITFESNLAATGGGIHIRWSNVRITSISNFKQNIAVFGGGIFADNSTVKFDDMNTFRGNQANHTGGSIYAARSVLEFLGVSSMAANRAARDGGGIYTRDDCVVNLLGIGNYQNNSAGDTGGGISAYRSNFNFAGQSTFNRNHAVEGGGFYAFKSSVNVRGESTFITNSASNCGGGFTVVRSTLHLNGSTTIQNNSAASGGGMYVVDSTVDTDGSNCFVNNMAMSEGGGIYAKESVMIFSGKEKFVSNAAGRKGAGVYISSTTLVVEGSSSLLNNSAEYGGGIYCESSSLTIVHDKSCYLSNMAFRGGALYFDLYSNFTLHQSAHLHFQDNNATELGGAIYAADVSGPGQFFPQQHVAFRRKCFFHILGSEQSLQVEATPLMFVNNTAGVRGSVLFGGLLEKCTFISDRFTSTLELFNLSIIHSKDDKEHSISSEPTQLCFCNKSKLNCTELTQSKNIFPGQSIEVSAIAIDQSGSAIPTLIHSTINPLNVSETISYLTGENCTQRKYSIPPSKVMTKPMHVNQVELYPSNRSESTMHLIVNITFDSCPIGFEQSNFTGECICDHRLWQYTNSCDIDRQAILRNASRTFWLGVWYNNGIPEGFIHHPYCPLDYCTRESRFFSLKSPNKQCNSNRSGLLCGKCKEGLSLVLGSSQCKECNNNYLALLIPFALAGVLLVILLLSLHLTVAAGTLHGLIFYANIVGTNHHIFFPQSSNNPASIFIAWLNLDLGIQTCFYNGMDTYTKTWLEFVFPVYVWVIVGFLVYISHYSVTVTKLLGSSPVPVLSTLFFLSYAKVLQTIIASLSLTILHYPHKGVVVWIHDANVSLVKYIPLVLVALLFLLFLFLPYTLLLLLGQWLQPKSHLCILSWVKNPKVKAILDTYHAPYKPKYRYWTGLLLLIRCALFLVFAFNISGDDSINLLVVSLTTSGIFVWFALLGKAYKSWYLNALELSFILNLGILAVATYHVNQSGGSQAAVAYTSVGIAFLTFVGIDIYHIYIRIKSKVQYIQRGHQLHNGKKCHESNSDNPENVWSQPIASPTVTYTEVSLQELRSPLDLLPYHQMNS